MKKKKGWMTIRSERAIGILRQHSKQSCLPMTEVLLQALMYAWKREFGEDYVFDSDRQST